MTSAQTREEDLDWNNRRLCIDGNCIGVIGPDGLCKECGTPYEGDAPESSSPVATDTHGQDTVESEPTAIAMDEGPEPGDTADAMEEDSDSEWENRRLCSDGNCIGVIGPDGLCRECGKPAGETEDD